MPPHCDTRDGPVVKAAKIALEQHNVNYILIWVPHRHEARPHTWRYEKRVNPRSYGVIADMGSEGCSFSGTVIPSAKLANQPLA